MAGIRIDWNALELAFENHAPDVRAYLDRSSGEVLVLAGQVDDDDAAIIQVQAHPEQYLIIEAVASREQYRMMERFIETVVHEPLKLQLADSIVGKGAFRRFKTSSAVIPMSASAGSRSATSSCTSTSSSG